MNKSAPKPARRSNADMSADTQASAVRAAIASLAEHGYAGTTISGIAQRVGVSRPALLYHFGTKNGLMAAAINAIYDEFESAYRAALHPGLQGAERLLAIFDASYRLTDAPSQMAQIELLLAARRDPSFRAEVAPTIEARDNAFKEAWHRLTVGFDGRVERLDLIRDIAVSTFRGITINRSLGHDSTSFDGQLGVLRKLLLDTL